MITEMSRMLEAKCRDIKRDLGVRKQTEEEYITQFSVVVAGGKNQAIKDRFIHSTNIY